MKIAVLCPSEIAIRRFMPALQKVQELQYVGVGVNSISERYGENYPSEDEIKKMLENEKVKAKKFMENYNGIIFDSYEELILSKNVDAVYIPLPPALHYKWAKKALQNGKHVLLEKPFTTSLNDTMELVSIAKERKLALHENYMFTFHSQLNDIDNIIKSGEIGDIRLYRISFGFPLRQANDFRYVKSLGGGALIDAGGYTMKYADKLLGNSARMEYAYINNIDGYEVDMYGSGAMVNNEGVTCQFAYGMDNNYKCELEAWGSQGCLTTGRVLTAPEGLIPTVTIRKGNIDEQRSLSEDNSFEKSIKFFENCIYSTPIREKSYQEIIRQAQLIEEFKEKSNNGSKIDKI